jgi:hypothetical protein
VALHLGTPRGIVVVTLSEQEFVRNARGRKDHNGNPFRSLDQIQEKPPAPPILDEVEQPAEEEPASERAKFDGRNKEFRRRCEAAYVDLAANRRLSAQEAAVKHDLLPGSFEQWLERRGQEGGNSRRALR